MDTTSYNIRVPKRLGRIAMIVAVTALIVAPLTAVATHSFNDVPNTHTFHDDIAWMKDSGVTKGCNPPANSLYCPDDDVTRGQMAAFMRRFSQYLGAEDGTPAQADNAANAETVDGFEASELQNRVLFAADSGDVGLPGGATTQVLTLDLTAGTYLLSSTGVLNNNAGSTQSANCTLTAGGESATVSPTADIFLAANVTAGDKEDVTVFLVTEIATAGTAILDCTTSAGWSGNIIGPQIAAMSVDSADVTVTNSASDSGESGDG